MCPEHECASRCKLFEPGQQLRDTSVCCGLCWMAWAALYSVLCCERKEIFFFPFPWGSVEWRGRGLLGGHVLHKRRASSPMPTATKRARTSFGLGGELAGGAQTGGTLMTMACAGVA